MAVYQKKLAETIKLSVLMPVFNERYLVADAIQRVLAFTHERVAELELIVVDDGSTDGTVLLLRNLAASHANIKLIEQPANRGKGAAIRRAIEAATGELCVIQDADLEYFPDDWKHLLRPFFEADADAVFGSRFLPREYRRVLYYWHSLGNQLLTLLSNVLTDLNLTDMETCYKMVRTELLRSIPIRSDGFAIEPELTAKLAKRGASIYEVPIRYAGRTYREGKKINYKDGLRALWAIAKWSFVDDIYRRDTHGATILSSLSQARQINRWIADSVADEIGAKVLEIGAGIGNLTTNSIPRERYLATDINPDHLSYLDNLSLGKPYLNVAKLDLADSSAFGELAGQFDTIVCINVLEHVEDHERALRNLFDALSPGGKVVLLVPQGQWLFSSLDEAVYHHRRYDKDELRCLVEDAGFELLSLREFNRPGVLGWLLNGKVLKRRYFSRIQLKTFNTLTPIFRLLDASFPWPGLSLIAIAQKAVGN